MIQRKDKRPSDSGEDRNTKRQRRGEPDEESSGIIEFTQPTAAGHPLSPADTFRVYVPHRPTVGVAPNSPGWARTDTPPVPIKGIVPIPAANAGGMSTPTCQPSKVVVPSKRSHPFRKDGPRKKRKTDSFVIVRIYDQRKDLEHTDEIEYALTPDGGLDLAGLSEMLNVKGCQVSRFIIPY